MRKLLGLTIGCFLTILFLCGFTSGENEFEIGNYNVDYSSKEWKEMSFQEQIDSVSLPVDYIEGLSTEDVVTWALEYPFLCDIYLFDSSVSALDYFKRTSYLFENMFSRDDIREVLIERLEDLYIKEDSVLSKKELFIIYYLANIKDKLSDDEITKLFDILNDEDFNRFFGKIIIEYAQPEDSPEDIDITRYEGFISSNQVFQSCYCNCTIESDNGTILAQSGRAYAVYVNSKWKSVTSHVDDTSYSHRGHAYCGTEPH